MGVSVTTRHFGATKALQEHATKRIGRALKNFEGGDVGISMEKVGPHKFVARATAKGSYAPMHAEASSRDMYVAVARAAARLQRQMDAAKGKVRATRRSGAPMPEAEEEVIA